MTRFEAVAKPPTFEEPSALLAWKLQAVEAKQQEYLIYIQNRGKIANALSKTCGPHAKKERADLRSGAKFSQVL